MSSHSALTHLWQAQDRCAAPYCRFLFLLASKGLPAHTLPSLPLLVPSARDASWEAYLPPWRRTRGCAWGRSRWSGGTSGTWHRSGICWPRRCRNKCPAGYSTWSWQGCPNLAGEKREKKCPLAASWPQTQTAATGWGFAEPSWLLLQKLPPIAGQQEGEHASPSPCKESGDSNAGPMRDRPHSRLLCLSQGINFWWRGGCPLHDHSLVLICQSSAESFLSSLAVAKAHFLFPHFPTTWQVLLLGLINLL